MIIFKKVIIAMFCAVMVITFSACGSKQSTNVSDTQAPKKFTVVTSFYPMYIFTQNIAKDISDVEVVNMTESQTGCLHDYQLSTADMRVLENANVFVINGAGMEPFMDKVTKQITNLKVIEASKGIELIKSEHEHIPSNANSDIHNEDKNHSSKDNEDEHDVNPHVWVGISGAIQEVKNITEQLSQIDTKNAKKYRKNMNEYVAKLEALKVRMKDSLKNLKNRNVVTFHEAFPYFAKEFDLNVVGVIEKEPGQEPSASEYANIIKTVKEKNVKALFTEEQYPSKSADMLAKETGAKVYRLDLVVTGPKDADPESYTKAMEKNLTVLSEALK
jgi:zinc transport system substrate-binding protein